MTYSLLRQTVTILLFFFILFFFVSRTDDLVTFYHIPIYLFIASSPILFLYYVANKPKIDISKLSKFFFLLVIFFMMLLHYNDNIEQEKIFGIIRTQIPLIITIFTLSIYFEVLLSKYNREDTFILLYKIKLFYCVVISLFGIILYFSDQTIFNFSQNNGPVQYSRMIGPVGSIKTFGYISAIGLIFSFYSNNFFKDKYLGLFIKYSSISICIVALFYSGHKGSMLAVICTSFLIILYKILNKKNFSSIDLLKLISTAVAILVSLILIVLLIISLDYNYLLYWYYVIFGSSELSFLAENNIRIDILQKYISYLLNTTTLSALIGHGHYALVQVYDLTAHNSFITLLLDHGIITLCLFIILFFILTSYFKVGFLVGNTIDSVAFSVLWFFFFAGFTNDVFLNVSSETYILCVIISLWLNKKN